MHPQNAEARVAYEQLAVDAAAIRKSDRSLTAERAFVKALEARPDLYELAKAYEPEPVEPVAKAESSIPVEIQKAADAISARKGASPTREQAIAQALAENPSLYQAWVDEERSQR